ncbi:hypothetical protein F5877DRAFT_73160, partial [Lentinula edodes]
MSRFLRLVAKNDMVSDAVACNESGQRYKPKSDFIKWTKGGDITSFALCLNLKERGAETVRVVFVLLFLVFVIIVPSSSNSHNIYVDYLVERASMGIEYDLRKQQIANYAAFAKLALLVYDITINMGREVRLVWSTSDRFRWSNVIYFTNRYPVVAYQIWSVCYTPNIPQASGYRHSLTMIALNLINFCDALYQFFWFFSFIPTRIAITVSWILRVYAVVDHGLVFAIMLSLLGLAIVGFDILQGVQSSCTHNTLSSETLSGVMTYISLAVFDILATLLVTNRMIQAIRGCGGFRKLARQNLSEYVLRSGKPIQFVLSKFVMLILERNATRRFIFR